MTHVLYTALFTLLVKVFRFAEIATTFSSRHLSWDWWRSPVILRLGGWAWWTA